MSEFTVLVSLRVNGMTYSEVIEPRLLLAYFLRDRLHLTGTHVGCDTSQCGACTVLVDGLAVKSCTMLAVEADGREVTTVEGLASGTELHPVQRGFWEVHGLQCGFCTPGMEMLAASLLADNSEPTEQYVREALDGALCRCTGYHNIVAAALYAAATAKAGAA